MCSTRGLYCLCALGFSLVLLGTTAWAADSLPTTNVITVPRGEWPGHRRGAGNAMIVENGTAYLATTGAGLMTVNVADPAAPRRLGNTDAGARINQAVVLRNGIALSVGWYDGLQVFDCTDPAHPQILTNFPTADNFNDIQVVGNYAFVVGFSGQLTVFDVQDPRRPAPISAGTAALPFGEGTRIRPFGQSLCVASQVNGVAIVDVRLPNFPRVTGRYNTAGRAESAQLVGTRMYVADGPAGLLILDARGSTPFPLGTLVFESAAKDVLVVGTIAYVATDGGSVHTVNVEDPSHPVLLHTQPVGGHPRQLVLDGSTLWVLHEEARLSAFTVNADSSLQPAGSLDTSGQTYDVVLDGDLAYVADGGAGLQIIDVTHPSQPVRVGHADLPGSARSVALQSDWAFVPCWDAGVIVVNRKDPASVSVVSRFETPGHATAVTIAGNIAAIADAEGGLILAGVGVDGHLEALGSYVPASPISHVVVSGTVAYCALDGKGVESVDISDPRAPKQVGFAQTPGGRLLPVSAGVLYQTSSIHLSILDVSTPTAPVYRTTLNSVKPLAGAKSENLAFLVSKGTLDVLDLFEPAFPRLVTSRAVDGTPRGIAATADLVAIAAGPAGLKLYSVSRGEPVAPVLRMISRDGIPRLVLETTPQRACGLERATRLAPEPDWTSWKTVTPTNSTAEFLLDDPLDLPTVFYRAVLP